VLGQVSASRSDRCTAEDGEADTYKVVGYVRVRVCILTGCSDNIKRRPSNGRMPDPLGLQKETTRAQVEKLVRGMYEGKSSCTDFIYEQDPGTRLVSMRQLVSAGIVSTIFLLRVRCQHIPCPSLSTTRTQRNDQPKILQRRPANDALRRRVFHPRPLWQRAASVWP
jgi:hypothetical protein